LLLRDVVEVEQLVCLAQALESHAVHLPVNVQDTTCKLADKLGMDGKIVLNIVHNHMLVLASDCTVLGVRRKLNNTNFFSFSVLPFTNWLQVVCIENNKSSVVLTDGNKFS
jgi:hypothetical protein